MTKTQPVLEFGLKRENEERRDGGCAIVYDPKGGKFAVGRQFGNGRLRFFSGGVDSNEDIQAGIIREVIEESGLHDFGHIEKLAEAMTHYYNSLRNVNRVAHATCYLIVLNSRDLLPVKLEEHEKFELVWASADEILANFKKENANQDNDHWIHFMEKGIQRLRELGLQSGN
jgi:8-oxo-dGTP pyrophosphatase MutT (NUDIX family)